MNTVTARMLLLVLVPLIVSGCRSKPDTPWPMAAVEVSVTYMGKPLEAAVVTFTNSDGRPDSFGITDEQGKTQLTTFESEISCLTTVMLCLPKVAPSPFS